MKNIYACCIFHGGTSGRRPEGSPGRNIKALMDRKEKRGVNGKKELEFSTLNIYSTSTLTRDILP